MKLDILSFNYETNYLVSVTQLYICMYSYRRVWANWFTSEYLPVMDRPLRIPHYRLGDPFENFKWVVASMKRGDSLLTRVFPVHHPISLLCYGVYIKRLDDSFANSFQFMMPLFFTIHDNTVFVHIEQISII